MNERLPLRVLPFDVDSFDWDRFESFCLAVVRALPDVKRADRYGKMGEAQRGIDIEAGARLFAEVAAIASGDIDRDRRQDDEEMMGWH